MRIVLRKMLKRKKLSVRQFAKRAGIRYTNAFKYMRTDINVETRTLQKWADAIGCRVKDLIEEDSVKKS